MRNTPPLICSLAVNVSMETNTVAAFAMHVVASFATANPSGTAVFMTLLSTALGRSKSWIGCVFWVGAIGCVSGLFILIRKDYCLFKGCCLLRRFYLLALRQTNYSSSTFEMLAFE